MCQVRYDIRNPPYPVQPWNTRSLQKTCQVLPGSSLYRHCARYARKRTHVVFSTLSLYLLCQSGTRTSAYMLLYLVFHRFVSNMVAQSVERYQSLEKGARYSLLHDATERTGDIQRARDEATNLLFAGRDTRALSLVTPSGNLG